MAAGENEISAARSCGWRKYSAWLAKAESQRLKCGWRESLISPASVAYRGGVFGGGEKISSEMTSSAVARSRL